MTCEQEVRQVLYGLRPVYQDPTDLSYRLDLDEHTTVVARSLPDLYRSWKCLQQWKDAHG